MAVFRKRQEVDPSLLNDEPVEVSSEASSGAESFKGEANVSSENKGSRNKKKTKRVCGSTDPYDIVNGVIQYSPLLSRPEFIGKLASPMSKLNGEAQSLLKDGNRVVELVNESGERLKLFMSLKYGYKDGDVIKAHSPRRKGNLLSVLLTKVK